MIGPKFTCVTDNNELNVTSSHHIFQVIGINTVNKTPVFFPRVSSWEGLFTEDPWLACEWNTEAYGNSAYVYTKLQTMPLCPYVQYNRTIKLIVPFHHCLCQKLNLMSWRMCQKSNLGSKTLTLTCHKEHDTSKSNSNVNNSNYLVPGFKMSLYSIVFSNLILQSFNNVTL